MSELVVCGKWGSGGSGNVLARVSVIVSMEGMEDSLRGEVLCTSVKGTLYTCT
jgi:hypothetical protein